MHMPEFIPTSYERMCIVTSLGACQPRLSYKGGNFVSCQHEACRSASFGHIMRSPDINQVALRQRFRYGLYM